MRFPLWFRRRAALLVCALVAGAASVNAQPKPSIILATTTSTADSGLLDVLVPRFEQERGITVKTIAVGSGAALRMASTGNADVVLVHAPDSERPYVAAGNLIDGRLVMHNDFMLVGPADDPAGVRQRRTIAEAMRAIAASGTFISRGDQSGTHAQELALWAAAGVHPRTLARREETGQGMGATLTIADQRRGYTLTDRGTYLVQRARLMLAALFQGDAQRARLMLAALFQGDASLRNIYHVYAVNPAKHNGVKLQQARQFIEFLTSPAIQRAIGAFKQDLYGESLFFPDALPAPAR